MFQSGDRVRVNISVLDHLAPSDRRYGRLRYMAEAYEVGEVVRVDNATNGIWVVVRFASDHGNERHFQPQDLLSAESSRWSDNHEIAGAVDEASGTVYSDADPGL